MSEPQRNLVLADTRESVPPLVLEPNALGGLLGAAPAGGEPPLLFAGEERFLKGRRLRRRATLVALVEGVSWKLLQKGEKALYLLPGTRFPTLLERLGLGFLWPRFQRVALLITDQRLIEMSLLHGQTALGTRMSSTPWSQVRELTLRPFPRRFALTPAQGRPQKWQVPLRGDGRFLALLLPLVRGKLVPGNVLVPRLVPLWHCPMCGAVVRRQPSSCRSCGVRFKTAWMATLMALAFPGAGLFYAGHPLLGMADLAIEVAAYGVVASRLLLAANRSAEVVAAVLAACLFAVTKLESVHAARLLAARAKPEDDLRRRFWHRSAVGGAALCLFAIAFPFLFVGSLDHVVSHDLVFDAGDLGWRGGSLRSAWGSDRNDLDKRSEWVHGKDWTVSVRAYPLEHGESFEDFCQVFDERRSESDQPPGRPFHLGILRGEWAVTRGVQRDGRRLVELQYLVNDARGRDVHIVTAFVTPEEADAVANGVARLLSRARWIDATG
jgi:hypothetical protein